MPETVQVGSATIVHLSDTERPYPAREVYPEVADAAWNEYRQALTADGSIVLNFGCYLVIADGRTVLVDTGWGPTYEGRLLDELAAAQVSPQQIDAVVCTHLHGDHIGWNVVEEGGASRPRFPRARYLLPEADWNHYTTQPEPSALIRTQVLPLESLGVMDLVNGEYTLSPSVTIVPTPGHTPGHQSVAILSGGAHGFILGDVAVSPVEAHETDWKNRFDWDSALAGRTRHAVLDRLERSAALVGASHFPKPGLGRFVREGGRRRWVDIDAGTPGHG